MFEEYEGFRDIQLFHSSCLVSFRDVTSAHRCLEDINSTTNFTAAYCKRTSFSSAATPKYGSSTSLYIGSYGDPFTPATSASANSPQTPISVIDHVGDRCSNVTPGRNGFGMYGGQNNPYFSSTAPNLFSVIPNNPLLNHASSSATLVEDEDEILPYNHNHMKTPSHNTNNNYQHQQLSTASLDLTNSPSNSIKSLASLPPSLPHSYSQLTLLPSLDNMNISSSNSSISQPNLASSALSNSSMPSDLVQNAGIVMSTQPQPPPLDIKPLNTTASPMESRPRASISSSSMSATSPSTTNTTTTVTTPSLSKSGSTLAMCSNSVNNNKQLESQALLFKEFLDSLVLRILSLEKENDGLKEQLKANDITGHWLNASPSPTDSAPNDADIGRLKAEYKSLREELTRTREKLEGLERAHKQRGVFEGLLAICD